VEIPEVRYAKTADGTHIAFQVFGQGPRDLVYVPGFISNLLLNWELPGMAHILDRLGRFARVVAIDHRGTGLSDRLPPGQLPPLETQMDDLTAVMDAVHIRKAHLFVGRRRGRAVRAVRDELPRARGVALRVRAHPEVVQRGRLPVRAR